MMYKKPLIQSTSSLLLIAFLTSAAIGLVRQQQGQRPAPKRPQPETQRTRPTQPPTAVISEKPELVIQNGHSDNIRSVVFSPDGKLIVSASSDKTLRLWEAESGRMLRVLDNHKDSVTSVAFSPDGKVIASASLDKTVLISDVKTGRLIHTLSGHSDEVNAVAFSSDGKMIASASRDETINLWDAANGDLIRSFEAPGSEFRTVAFSPDGKLVASGGADKRVKLWQVSDGQLLRTLDGHTDTIRSVTFSPASEGGLILASAGDDNLIKLWRVDSGTLLQTLQGHRGIVTSVVFSRDGKLLFSGSSDKTIKVWDVQNGRPIRSIDRPSGGITSVALSPDGRTIAAGSYVTIELWSSITDKWIRTLDSRLSNIKSVAYSSNGKMIALARRNSVKLWDLRSGSSMHALDGHSSQVNSVAFSGDGKFLASASLDRTIKIWDLATGRLLRDLTGHLSNVSVLAFSSDSRFIASGSVDRTVKLWDVQTGRTIKTFEGHFTLISSVAFSPDGKTIASGSYDNSIKLWDVESVKAKFTLTGHASEVTGVAFSPDGKMLASCSRDKTIKLWDPQTGQLIRTLEGHAADVFAVAFNPDGRTLVSGSYDKTLRIWDSKTGSVLRTLEGHSSPVVAVAYSPDGRFIVSGGEDASTKLWSSDSSQPLCTLVTFNEGGEWLVISPDGLFDGSPEAWKSILWRFASDTFDTAPVEAFFNEFYYPGLLADVVAGKRPKAAQNLTRVDRRQPQVRLSLVDKTIGTDRPISSRKVKVRIEITEAQADASHGSGSGARDVRLFRNGSLIKVWRGDLLTSSSTGALEETVSIVAGENHFTAYAFNKDNIKSADATFVLTGANSLRRKGTAYVVVAGVNEYSNPRFNLRYAVADAQEFGETILQKQNKLGNFARVEVISLLNKDATKENILGALAKLAGGTSVDSELLSRIKPAEPEDAVIVYFAGHGTSQKSRFYLIPHDLGYDGPIDGINESSLKTLLDHSISDRKLAEAFERIDATDLLMVIDACNSGQALESDEKRRGPMNSKGLAQLAYEKGLYILTAAQGYQAALEAAELGHGFLTYALVEEGLKNAAADTEPKDGKILIREWVDYAVARVPEMQEAALQGSRGLKIVFLPGDEKVSDPTKRNVQRPRVFYRREEEPQPLIVEKVSGN